MPYFLLAINIVLMALGQMFFKQAANFYNGHNSLSFVLKYLYNPWLYAAIFFFAVSTFVWVKILTQMKLSVAYPMLSLCYVLTAILAYFVFGEKLNLVNYLGIFFIMVGVSLISLK